MKSYEIKVASSASFYSGALQRVAGRSLLLIALRRKPTATRIVFHLVAFVAARNSPCCLPCFRGSRCLPFYFPDDVSVFFILRRSALVCHDAAAEATICDVQPANEKISARARDNFIFDFFERERSAHSYLDIYGARRERALHISNTIPRDAISRDIDGSNERDRSSRI